MVAMPVHARWRNETSQPLRELKRSKPQLSAPVRCRLGKPIDEPTVVRRQCSNPGRSMEPLKGEGWTRAVAQQALDTRTVLTFDTNRRVDAEAPRPLPREHAARVGFVE
jgi:hypothetical protein